MNSYNPPLKDISFALHHIAGLDHLAQLPKWQNSGLSHTTELLAEAGRLAKEVLAPLNRTGDIAGSSLNSNGDVITPKGFSHAYKQYTSNGWAAISAEPEYGGAGFPLLVDVAIQEMFASANLAFSLCPTLSQGAVAAIGAHGSAEQKARWLPSLINGECAGTMLLTEPQAGSDVGALTTRAEVQADGSYKLWGQKIFITYGDHNMTQNIAHCVLARIPNAPVGTRGISLFIVPKHLSSKNGNPDLPNNIRCIGLEDKIGIHASPTCVMELDGATGELVGEPNQGMRAMFTMMNKARLFVGLQGLSISQQAYQLAASFAAQRQQGQSVSNPKHSAEKAHIQDHPDVRRMLLEMRTRTEAMRGLIYLNATACDLAAAHPDPTTRQHAQQRADLLTPVSKAWCSDQGVDIASLGIQVHGGMGYVEETGAAQLWRDSRIAPIYEGTNGIQAIDLVTRKLPVAKGAALQSLLAEMSGLDAHLDRATQTTTHAAQWLTEHPGEDALAGATPFLEMLGLTLGGWVMARTHQVACQALAVATKKPDLDADTAFWVQKRTSARFYLEQILPKTTALLPAVTAGIAALQ